MRKKEPIPAIIATVAKRGKCFIKNMNLCLDWKSTK